MNNWYIKVRNGQIEQEQTDQSFEIDGMLCQTIQELFNVVQKKMPSCDLYIFCFC